MLGALYLANKRPRAGFTAGDEELLGVLAAHAAIALTNARLYERERELTVAEERTRLARELHDAVAQRLFSLRLTAGAAAELVTADPQRARAQLAEVQQLAAEALAELRSAIFSLRPADLSDDGLADTLRKHLEVLRRVHHVRIEWDEWDADAAPLPPLPPLPPLAPEVEDVVFRVAQEALHNALRHAGAGRITVSLRGSGPGNAAPRAVLEVRDDGAGFDVTAHALGSRQLGLASMRARALGMGGAFAVSSVPGGGTTVRLEVPGA